jgi:RNA polymerase sigma factor (sigma-70 family)
MSASHGNTLLRHVRMLAAQQATAELSDQALMQRLAAGPDAAALEALVRRHGSMVLGVCRRVLDNLHDAEDALQATFLVLIQKAATVRSPGSVSCWLHGVAYRLACRAKADAARRRAHESRAPMSVSFDPVTEISRREARVALDDALAGLPERYRAALIMCCLEGKGRDEAAKELHCSVNALRNRLEQGRELLRRRLARCGVTVPAALLAGMLAEGVAQAQVAAGSLPSWLGTVRAACWGVETSAGVSPQAAALAKGLTKAMLVAKVKLWLTLLLALGLMAGAAGFAVYEANEADPANRPNPPQKKPLPRQASRVEDLRAAKADKPESSAPYLVYPVTTELQRKLISVPADLFVVVDTTEVLNDNTITWSAIKPIELRKQLSKMKKPDAHLHLTLFFRAGTSDNPDTQEVLRLALRGFGHEAGFSKVTVGNIYVNSAMSWKEYIAGFSGATSPPASVREPATGTEQVKVYPVRTELSRYLTGKADCAVVLVNPVKERAIPKQLRETIADHVARLKLTNKARIYFHGWQADVDLRDEFMDLGTSLGFKASSVTER